MTNNELLKEQAYNVMELIEDTVEMLCDDHVISGEKVWTMVGALAAVSYTRLTLPTNREV